MIGLDGSTCRQEMNIVDVFVLPGMKNNAKITLCGQGNQQLKREATDLHITFKLKDCEAGTNSSLFRRREDTADMFYTHKVKLIDALQCKPIEITTLDGRKLKVAADSVLAAGTAKIVEGEGLPILCDDTKEIKKQFDLL